MEVQVMTRKPRHAARDRCMTIKHRSFLVGMVVMTPVPSHVARERCMRDSSGVNARVSVIMKRNRHVARVIR